MSNGPDTHEWRLEQLEAWRDKMEKLVWRGVVAIIGNLVGVAILLALEILRVVVGR